MRGIEGGREWYERNEARYSESKSPNVHEEDTVDVDI
jgi:hypothetical protein